LQKLTKTEAVFKISSPAHSKSFDGGRHFDFSSTLTVAPFYKSVQLLGYENSLHRASLSDIVLRRRRKRVLVSDYSVGAWQITRETLRAAHRLYLQDRRDYSLLPEHLRPSRELNLNTLHGPVLTTYAGLLLRELLDHYHGDVQEAIGAYNGGTVAPNLRYALAVAGIADYARRILEHAPILLADDPTKQPASKSRTPVAVDGTAVDLPFRVVDLDRLEPAKL
jgi:hypothetical protein